MAIFKKGIYTPGHKPEKSLREELDEKREARKKTYPVSKDARPLPHGKYDSCFVDETEKHEADTLWKKENCK